MCGFNQTENASFRHHPPKADLIAKRLNPAKSKFGGISLKGALYETSFKFL